MAQGLNRKQISELFRPTGPKYVTTINMNSPTVGASSGGTQSVIQAIDLTLPIRGFRFIIKGRIAVATANYTAVNPESLLNLINTIQITGTNRRQGGNVTPFFGDLATLYALGNLNQNKSGLIQVNGTQAYRPGIPSGISSTPGNVNPLVPLTTAGSPYDFIVQVDIPLAPFGMSGPAVSNGVMEAGFLARQEEWKDSVTFKFIFPSVVDNSANPLGTSAATTVTAITAFGSGSGTPSIDIYILPVIMGSTKSLLVPGVLSRSTQPINTSLLTATGNNVELLRMQKQMTPRIYLKVGVGTSYPVFTSLSDSIVTAFGHQIGTDRNVRDVLDWFAHRAEHVEHYDVMGVQGYNLLDFINSGNVDSSYPGDTVGDGAVMRLVGNITGTANGQGLVVQEQILQKPEGPLFS